MAQPSIPRLLPSYPGLDANQHGHWGKHNQNNHQDGRWNDMNVGSMLAGRLHVGKRQLHKAINLRLGNNNELSAGFDAATLTYASIWGDGFVKFNPFRWGVSRGAGQQGPSLFEHQGHWHAANPEEAKLITPRKYIGAYRNGKRVVFSYEVGKTKILDHPWVLNAGDQKIFTRTLNVDQSNQNQVTLPLVQLPADAKFTPEHMHTIQSKEDKPNGKITTMKTFMYQKGNDRWLIAYLVIDGDDKTKVEKVDGHMGMINLSIKNLPTKAEVGIYLWKGKAEQAAKITKSVMFENTVQNLTTLTKPGKTQWPQTFTVKGTKGKDNNAYAVDSIPVPFKNQWKSMMMFSGIDFLSDGRALISTLMGDIWIVSGLNSDLQKVTWKRFAAGLSQPFGIKITNDVIYVLGKDQLSILHDRDKNDEVDFIENYSNAYLEPHSHTHVFGLDHDRQGNFYFICFEKLYQLKASTRELNLMSKRFP